MRSNPVKENHIGLVASEILWYTHTHTDPFTSSQGLTRLLFRKKLKCLEDETVPAILEIDNVDPVIFRHLLEYIYTKSCPLLQEGPCAIAINVPDSNGKNCCKNYNSRDVNPLHNRK